MFGRAHGRIKGRELDRRSAGIDPVSIRRGRQPGKGSRIAWIVAGALAAAVTLAVVVWEVLDRTDDADAERTGEEAAEPALRRKWWSAS
ncbi:hypothetical protein QFZ23_004426 [Arthrobacter globiformis]|uniref:hypothetical protein n=1 Tax=Arthrobacter globiformis TaxID=1665 RepID=UPI0027838334|nr:hypothetical protein [Arthrobacter globiformis]MDQ1060525.1 hypothetical protein [Arthrobacter globiformis]